MYLKGSFKRWVFMRKWMHHPYVTVPFLLGILGFSTTQIQAQSDPTTTSQTIPVAGTVLDADTHQPIPGATIALQDPSGKMLGEQRVGANGEFRLAVAKKQIYTLNAKAFGYDANSKQLSFTSDLTDAIKGYPVELHKAGKTAAATVAPPTLTSQTASTSPVPPVSTQPASPGNSTPEPTVTTPKTAPTPVATTAASTAPAPAASTVAPKPVPTPVVTPPATSEQSAAVVTASAPVTAKNRRGTAATRRQAAVAQATAPAAVTPSAPGSSVAPPKTLDAKVSNTTPLLIAPKGEPTQLKSIRFAQSKPELLPDSQAELDQLLAFMNGNPKAEIELAGHTDNQGGFEENIQLSRLRVEAVKEYLVRNGIAASRIVAKGYGPSRPIASNNHEETRRLNRRVEFTVTKE